VRTMHILIIPSWYPSRKGDVSGIFFRDQAIALQKAGCKVGVLTLQQRSLVDLKSILTGRYDASYELDSGVHTYSQHTMKWFPGFPSLHALMWRVLGLRLFSKYVKEQGWPDLIHVHSMVNSGIIANAIREKFDIPYVVTEHSTDFARGKVTGKKRLIMKKIAKGASLRFAVSSPFGRLLTIFFGSEASEWKTVPNAVNEKFFQVSDSVFNEDGFIFLNICLLTEKKGVDLLLRAFSKAFKDLPDVKLRIGGDGPQREFLEQLAQDLNISDQVTFLGMLSRDHVYDEMGAADAFVLSSVFETFGVVVAESLARGKPVISTCSGGPEDIVQEDDGILVPVNDIESLASAIFRLYEQYGIYDADKIRVSCYQRFSEQAVSRILMSHYHNVLEGGNNSSWLDSHK
ncbi:glycosyltransferase, partial [Marinobacter sp.]